SLLFHKSSSAAAGIRNGRKGIFLSLTGTPFQAPQTTTKPQNIKHRIIPPINNTIIFFHPSQAASEIKNHPSPAPMDPPVYRLQSRSSPPTPRAAAQSVAHSVQFPCSALLIRQKTGRAKIPVSPRKMRKPGKICLVLKSFQAPTH